MNHPCLCLAHSSFSVRVRYHYLVRLLGKGYTKTILSAWLNVSLSFGYFQEKKFFQHHMDELMYS